MKICIFIFLIATSEPVVANGLWENTTLSELNLYLIISLFHTLSTSLSLSLINPSLSLFFFFFFFRSNLVLGVEGIPQGYRQPSWALNSSIWWVINCSRALSLSLSLSLSFSLSLCALSWFVLMTHGRLKRIKLHHPSISLSLSLSLSLSRSLWERDN